MTRLWEQWEGVSLPGDFTLEKWVGGDDNAASFRTSVAPDGRRAVAKLVREAVGEGGALDLWQRARQLRHPNLVELLDFGRAEHDGESVVYAVFEAPDDTLAAALTRSPLNPEEAREVLDSIIGALRYLHAQGLAHGALDPEHIVAVGDRIKLSSDALREAEDLSAYREDVRLLGELWQQALMAASPMSAEIAARAADPNPEARWTLAKISAALEPPRPTVRPPEPPEPMPAPPPPVVSLPPPTPSLPPLPPRPTRERAASHPFPKWIIVGLAAVLLLILTLHWRRPGVAAQTQVAPVSYPVEPPVPAPLPRSAIPAAPKPSPMASPRIWRVIAYTYSTRDAASKKVRQLNADHPGLNATVFLPKDNRGYYLVALGGLMTHEDAVHLQRSARGKGLPRDLYVQNYSH